MFRGPRIPTETHASPDRPRATAVGHYRLDRRSNDGQMIKAMITDCSDHGLDLRFWVELRGFEPLAPSMRTRCATGLRYSPKNGCQRSKLSRLLARRRSPASRDRLPGSRSGDM